MNVDFFPVLSIIVHSVVLSLIEVLPLPLPNYSILFLSWFYLPCTLFAIPSINWFHLRIMPPLSDFTSHHLYCSVLCLHILRYTLCLYPPLLTLPIVPVPRAPFVTLLIGLYLSFINHCLQPTLSHLALSFVCHLTYHLPAHVVLLPLSFLYWPPPLNGISSDAGTLLKPQLSHFPWVCFWLHITTTAVSCASE